jgi:hypothetical protein
MNAEQTKLFELLKANRDKLQHMIINDEPYKLPEHPKWNLNELWINDGALTALITGSLTE